MAKGKVYLEKRKQKRVDKKYEINYMLVPTEFTSQIKRAMGVSKDLSTGGVRVEGDIIGKPGDIIKAEIIKTDSNFIVFAEIKWVKASEHQFGVAFLSLKAHDEETLEEMME